MNNEASTVLRSAFCIKHAGWGWSTKISSSTQLVSPHFLVTLQSILIFWRERGQQMSILDTSQDMTGITIPSHVLSFESIYLPAVKCVSTKFVGEICYKDWIMMRVRNKAAWWSFSSIHSFRRAWWSHFHHTSLCSETRDDLILFANKRHYSYLYYKNRPLIWKDSLITS